MQYTELVVLQQPEVFNRFVSTNNPINMKKIALSLIGIIGKLFSFSTIRHNTKRLLKDSSGINFKRRHENNGERWFHILPETGESFLGSILFQFEVERAKVLALA
jgi:hypothetical protein